MLCLGIDSGTTSTKTLVLDIESGKVLASTKQSYETISGLPHGHVEQDPGTWIDAVSATIREAVAQIGNRKSDIVAIGVSAQQHGLVTLDARNEPIRPAKLWCDTSTGPQAEKLNKAFGATEQLISRTGNIMVPGYTAPKLLWLKENEPHNFRRIRTVLLPHDYINSWLTGERQMEYGDASGTGLLDVQTRQWHRPLFDFIDKNLFSKFPPLGSSMRPAGLLRDSLRQEWGLSGEILVSAGSGDNMLGALGTGNIKQGIVTVSLGTSGTVYAFTEKPVIDSKSEIATFCDSTDHWLLLACTMNVAVGIERVANLFGWDVPTLEAKVASVPAGARGLLFLPYLQGERLPNLPHGSGVLHGLNLENMNPPEMARSVVEGITMGLAYGMKRMIDLGVDPTELRLTGGGSRSAVWQQIVADVFGYPVVALKISEAAALGGAIQAAWTHCQVKGRPVALEKLVRNLVKIDKKSRKEPRKNNRALYTDLRARQNDLTRKLAAGGFL
jgi:xylulokinase